ncbi:hypothetical protein K2Y00_00070 [Patescibacteria group bacterium]|nr:hypothetical protein [Patescibacteria group bacterium]
MSLESFDKAQVLAMSRAEAIAKLTEYELLGLDKPTKDQLLSNRDEAEHVSKVVYLLHQAGKNEVMLNAILGRFNLNEGAYDEKENPEGIFEKDVDVKDKTRLKILLTARLIGANSYVLRTFFVSKNTTQGLSVAALAAVEDSHKRRERYPVDHVGEFPAAAASYARIRTYGGPDIHDIFHADATIPAIGDWIMRKGAQSTIIFDHVMVIVADALSGEKTEADIARERKIPTSTVNAILRRTKHGKNQVLSDAVLDLIDIKIKKGK